MIAHEHSFRQSHDAGITSRRFFRSFRIGQQPGHDSDGDCRQIRSSQRNLSMAAGLYTGYSGQTRSLQVRTYTFRLAPGEAHFAWKLSVARADPVRW